VCVCVCVYVCVCACVCVCVCTKTDHSLVGFGELEHELFGVGLARCCHDLLVRCVRISVPVCVLVVGWVGEVDGCVWGGGRGGGWVYVCMS
jgi:hypothetical protein